jgi:hypothetical protein
VPPQDEHEKEPFNEEAKLVEICMINYVSKEKELNNCKGCLELKMSTQSKLTSRTPQKNHEFIAATNINTTSNLWGQILTSNNDHHHHSLSNNISNPPPHPPPPPHPTTYDPTSPLSEDLQRRSF